MKKQLFAITIMALLVDIAYIVVLVTVCVHYDLFANNSPYAFEAILAALFVIAIPSPISIAIDLRALYSLTGGETYKSVLQDHFYSRGENPYAMRFTLFMARYPVLMYIMVLIPLFYGVLKLFFIVLNLLGPIRLKTLIK